MSQAGEQPSTDPLDQSPGCLGAVIDAGVDIYIEGRDLAVRFPRTALLAGAGIASVGMEAGGDLTYVVDSIFDGPWSDRVEAQQTDRHNSNSQAIVTAEQCVGAGFGIVAAFAAVAAVLKYRVNRRNSKKENKDGRL